MEVVRQSFGSRPRDLQYSLTQPERLEEHGKKFIILHSIEPLNH